MSQFVWLDYSEHERRKMLDIIDLFRERETRDELGIGSVRDAFADLLFPGTSTIMTRARYYLLVAWLYRRLEERRVDSAKIAERARRAELDLIAIIEKSDDSEGNIGTRVGKQLKRLPSNIYWQGLGVWGIRNFAGSQEQYHRSLDAHYTQIDRLGRRTPERDREHDDLVFSNWHGGLIEPPKKFPAECSLCLSRRESEYLIERIRLGPLTANSLLAELASQRRAVDDDVLFIWQHPRLSAVPAPLRNCVEHAQTFSELMQGAPLLYNLMLAEQARRKADIEKYRDLLAEWAESLARRSGVFAAWQQDRFWEIVFKANPQVSKWTKDFIEQWWTFALDGDASRLRNNQDARAVIYSRERKLKKNLARLDNPRALELWNGESGTAQLDFRWNITRDLLNDIAAGLEPAHA
jgi:hypothetical protein